MKYISGSGARDKDKMYGTSRLGARGQVVIPAAARRDLGLKPGDQLMVVGRFGMVLGIVKIEQVTGLVNEIMARAGGKKARLELKKRLEKMLG